MILAVTLNPSVDVRYKMDQFQLDTVNRVADPSKTAGGKGLNIARVLRQLEEDVAATGFLGGSLGDFIRTQLAQLGVRDYFVGISGHTRNCIAMIHDGKQTEILEAGPEIIDSEADLLLEKFTSVIQEVDIITVSGSMPKGLPTEFYGKLLEIAHRHNTPILFDTSGESLKCTLVSEYKPFLVKPNLKELTDLLGREIDGEDQIKAAINDSTFRGIPWIVITLGAEGAIVKHQDTIYRVQIPNVKAINPVGSGDSVIAGFAAGLVRKLPKEELIKFGLAMGVLNAIEEKTGYINPEKVDWCIERMSVEKI